MKYSPEELDALLGKGASDRVASKATEALIAVLGRLGNLHPTTDCVIMYLEGYCDRLAEERSEKSNNLLITHPK